MNSCQALYQSLSNFVHILHLHGVSEAVLSPGSRSAALALSFLRDSNFKCYHIIDERSAAYFALGRAKQTGLPVVLICTSGTAALNYAPAIAEAYYQKNPLIVLTADRPKEWVNQADNQAIMQDDLYGKYVAKYYSYPIDLVQHDSNLFSQRIANESALIACNKSKPVHINVPIREPFYEQTSYLKPQDDLMFINHIKSQENQDFDESLLNQVQKANCIWLVLGMGSTLTADLVEDFCLKYKAIPIVDPLAKAYARLNKIYSFDAWIDQLQLPDLILYEGNHFLSKNLKTILRKANVPAWAFSESLEVVNPFLNLTYSFKQNLDCFLRALTCEDSQKVNGDNLAKIDLLEQQHRKQQLQTIDREFHLVQAVLKQLPKDSVLHLGNSTPARYPLKMGFLLEQKNTDIYANRGTSGIDGSVSTAVGMAQNDNRRHYLIIGDLSMMYDRNGLWNSYLPHNFCVVVVNNQGGGIFRRIAGPSKQAEIESYFTAKQQIHFKPLAEQHGLTYHKISSIKQVKQLDFQNIKHGFVELVIE